MTQWQGDIAEPQRESFKQKLAGLRADRLLAVSLVGSFDGVLEVLYGQEKSNTALSVLASTRQTHNDSRKTLGDVNADLVYTPITPCRIVDTRTSQGGPGIRPANSTTAFNAVAASFAAQGGAANTCNIPAGAAAMAGSFAMLNASSLGFITLWAVDTAQPTAATGLFNPTSQQTLNSSASIVPLCTGSCTAGKQFNVFVSGALDVAFDVSGYFKAPGGVLGDITEINTGTAATTGLTGGVASGIASLTLAPTFKLPQGCAANQIAKWNGAAWACAADDAGPANAFVHGGNTFALGAGVASVLGNNDNRPLTVQVPQSTIKLLVDPVNGDDGLRISYATDPVEGPAPNTINGSRANSVAAGASGATISGGGFVNAANQVMAKFGTVGGGYRNTAGRNAVAAGGDSNQATGFRAVVGGGSNNIASGIVSAIPGGSDNQAVGQGSFAAGSSARANHDNAFVWGTDFLNPTTSTGPKQFVIRANGGIRLPGAGENQPGNAAKQSGTNMFTHVVPASGPCRDDGPFGRSRTAIDHPLTNGKPDAILVVTPNIGTRTTSTSSYSKAVSVMYDDDGGSLCTPAAVGRWMILNAAGDQDMVAGLKFNVFVVNP